MKRIIKSVLSVLCTIWIMGGGVSYASPKYHFVMDDGEVIAEISLYESNRISVKGDRISSVVSSAEGWGMDHNKTTGDLFLVPGEEVTGVPVNIFVTTEKHHTYKLILIPAETEAKQVILFNGQNNQATDRSYGQAYYSFVADKIKAVATNETVLSASNVSQQESTIVHENYKVVITHMGILIFLGDSREYFLLNF